MQKSSVSTQNPKQVLRQIVVVELGQSISEFQAQCGYKTYAHAWQLLEGEAQVTDATLGRILRAYGPDVAGRIAAAMPIRALNGDS